MNGEWWKCGPPRDVDAEINAIESGQERMDEHTDQLLNTGIRWVVAFTIVACM